MHLVIRSLSYVQVNAFPGEDISLGVLAFDELDARTSAVVRLRDESTTTFGMSSSAMNMPPMRMEVRRVVGKGGLGRVGGGWGEIFVNSVLSNYSAYKWPK